MDRMECVQLASRGDVWDPDEWCSEMVQHNHHKEIIVLTFSGGERARERVVLSHNHREFSLSIFQPPLS
jgi:hypothetical protein